MRLNRSFIAISTLDKYLDTIKNKLKHTSGIDEKNVEYLFRVLENYEKSDNKNFEQIMKKLSEYTEEFVLINSFYIARLLNLSKEERQIIMVEFGDLNYSNDLNLIDMIKHIQEVFIIRISNYIQKLIENIEYDKEKLLQMAFDIKNNKNDNYRIQIMEEVIQIFPSINKEPIFSKLFLDMLLNINEIGYEIFKNEIVKKESIRNDIYLDYDYKARRKTLEKNIKRY